MAASLICARCTKHCGEMFASEGPYNRMCKLYRQRADRISPFAPDLAELGANMGAAVGLGRWSRIVLSDSFCCS